MQKQSQESCPLLRVPSEEEAQGPALGVDVPEPDEEPDEEVARRPAYP